jgi:hypothetical protein
VAEAVASQAAVSVTAVVSSPAPQWLPVCAGSILRRLVEDGSRPAAIRAHKDEVLCSVVAEEVGPRLLKSAVEAFTSAAITICLSVTAAWAL